MWNGSEPQRRVPHTFHRKGWGVNVTGTLAGDGTVTAMGQGTVADVPNIQVAFSGTYDEATKRLVGTYSMDTASVISPGHPVVYNVDVSGVP